jgi:hypothetical protein
MVYNKTCISVYQDDTNTGYASILEYVLFHPRHQEHTSNQHGKQAPAKQPKHEHLKFQKYQKKCEILHRLRKKDSFAPHNVGKT